MFRITADVCADNKAEKQSVRSIFQPTRTNSYNDAYISLATSRNEGDESSRDAHDTLAALPCPILSYILDFSLISILRRSDVLFPY